MSHHSFIRDPRRFPQVVRDAVLMDVFGVGLDTDVVVESQKCGIRSDVGTLVFGGETHLPAAAALRAAVPGIE